MISCYSCASFIVSRFGGLGILCLELYFHAALETTSQSRFPGTFFWLLGAFFFLEEKSPFYVPFSVFSLDSWTALPTSFQACHLE